MKAPAAACDCHVHVYDGRYPAVAGARLKPPDASVAEYRQLQRRTGTERVVFVTPSTYGTDNRPMLQGLRELGSQARGIAVIDESFSSQQIGALDDAGVRGVRLNLSLGVSNAVEQIVPLAHRIAPFGWHLQLLAAPDVLAGLATELSALPVPLVFDHFGRLPPAMAYRHPAHALILRLLDAGRAWLKLSGCYIVSEAGPPDYDDVGALARTYLATAAHRLVWGSDWPHASASAGHQTMPDDARQIDLLAEWSGDRAVLHEILVANPAALYGFTE